MKKYLPMLMVVLVVLAFAGMAVACPMCKDSVPASDADSAANVPSGFNNSVYLLLGTFLTVLTLVVGSVFKAVQTSKPRMGFPIEPTDKR